ncbi:MAG: tetratricopeptide (TPR) repeat protein [Crocinitomix sp.]
MNPTNKKEQADSIAQSIYDRDTNTEKLAQRISELGANIVGGISSKKNEPVNETEKIGIYKSEQVNGENGFVRSDEYKSHFYLSQRHTDFIRRDKTTTKRILLFGESVARGLFYEPYYGPAQVLEEILNTTSSATVEVVDLAVTSSSSVEILQLCKQSLVLSGDTVVIFAGNNWKREILLGLSPVELNKVYEEITSGNPNFENVNEQIQYGFDRMVNAFFSILTQIYKDKGVDLLFVLPEFNLMDFRSSELDQEMYMPNGRTQDWIAVNKKGIEALKNENFVDLEALAEELIQLNPFHPKGYEWLADCRINEGQVQAAKELLRSAYDKGIYRATITFPRIYGELKKAIVRNCAEHNVNLIRSDEIFENHGEHKIPDKTLFLDYCHLSSEGIVLSMKACAEKLANIWNDVSLNTEKLETYELKTDPKVLSKAHFFAALHNNLCGQNFEIVDYHCKKTFEFDKDAINNMRGYMELSISNTPWNLSKEALNFIENELLGLGLVKYEGHARMDSHITRSIRGILDANNLHNNYAQILSEKYGAETLEIDLLDPKFAVNSFQIIGELEEKGKSFYSEINLKTAFNFFIPGNDSVKIKITLRIPDYSTATPVQVFINNQLIEKINAGTTWRTFNIPVSTAQLIDGVNSISIHWPLPATNPKKGVILGSITDFENAVSPVLGELYNLTVER